MLRIGSKLKNKKLLCSGPELGGGGLHAHLFTSGGGLRCLHVDCNHLPWVHSSRETVPLNTSAFQSDLCINQWKNVDSVYQDS